MVEDQHDLANILYAPRDLFDFVASFAGEKVAHELKDIRKDLDGAMVMFNHYQHSLQTGTPKNMSQAMLYRGSARLLPNNWPGADIILPLLLKDGTFSMIIIQVKLRKDEAQSFETGSVANEWYNNTEILKVLNPTNRIIKNREAVISGCQELGDKYLRIVMNVSSKNLELTREYNRLNCGWQVYKASRLSESGLICRGTFFECLTDKEIDSLERFTRIGHSHQVISDANPQLFGNLHCPPVPRYLAGSSQVCSSILGSKNVFVENPLEAEKEMEFFSKYSTENTAKELYKREVEEFEAPLHENVYDQVYGFLFE
jgi:hypothetical protein